MNNGKRNEEIIRKVGLSISKEKGKAPSYTPTVKMAMGLPLFVFSTCLLCNVRMLSLDNPMLLLNEIILIVGLFFAYKRIGSFVHKMKTWADRFEEIDDK